METGDRSETSPTGRPANDVMPELGFYALAGGPSSPRPLLGEVRAADSMGLGSAWISERFNIKEAASLSGAAAAVSERLGVATGVTNHTTRHPLVTASWATTMHELSGGRFCLGVGRGMDRAFAAMGLPPITSAQLADFAGLMRRLWRGEVVAPHDGPIGRFPALAVEPGVERNIPLALSAFGPKSLELGGRSFDAVLLHTFFTDETLVRCIRTVKQAAEMAGRDPASVRVWSCFATVGDHLSEPLRLKKTVGRMSTYLQAYGDLMVKTNGWDLEALKRFRSDPLVAGFRGAIDARATTEQLQQIAPLIPDEWLAPAANGSPSQCVDAINRQFELGADGVILHGSSPDELRPIVDAYRSSRTVSRFAHLSPNPGLLA